MPYESNKTDAWRPQQRRTTARNVTIILVAGAAALVIAVKGAQYLNARQRISSEAGQIGSFLDLADSSVSDADVAYLPWVADFDMLDLSGTAISDEALEHLAGVEELRYVDLSRTSIRGRDIVNSCGSVFL